MEKEKPKVELLAKLFKNYVVPKEVIEARKMGLPLIGSKNFTKAVLFADEVQLNNEDIDYWMSFGLTRMENEIYTDYKNRQKLQRALLKYREYLYDYSVYEK